MSAALATGKAMVLSVNLVLLLGRIPAVSHPSYTTQTNTAWGLYGVAVAYLEAENRNILSF